MADLIHGGDIYSFEDRKVIDFSANINPLGIPTGVKEAIISNLDLFAHYPDPLYRKLSDKIAKAEGVESSQVICGNGAADLIFRLAIALKPKKALVLAPTFAEYEIAMNTVDCEVAHYMLTEENNFEVDEGFICELKKNAYDIVFICNPNNPTGYLYTQREMDQIRDLVKKYDLFLFADEVYREYKYIDSPFISACHLDGIENNVVLIDSVSKRYSECGIRIGALITKNKEIRDAAMKFCQARLSPPLLGQIVAEASLDAPEEYYRAVYDEYVERRKCLIDGLNDIPGVYSPMPMGAFYTVARLPVDDSEKFCRWCLEKFNYEGETVMMAPASGFYTTPGAGINQVRIAYVLKREDLERALVILRAALETYPDRTNKK